MQPVRRLLLIMLCLSWAAASANAQRMPQDSWYFSYKLGGGSGDGQFSSPSGIAISPDGLVFVVDDGNNRIQVLDQDGTFVRKWGSYGSGGIAVSSDGLVYVADSGNHRIQVFKQDGTFVRKWGSYGSGDGEFKKPRGIAVSPDGLVFVADSENNRIQVFSQDGSFVRKWGSSGPLDGQFYFPSGIAVSPDGLVFVANDSYSSSRIQVFNQDGSFVRKWGSSSETRAIAIAPDGLFAVISGDFVRIYQSDGTVVRSIGGSGYANEQFMDPDGIAVSSDGLIFVADSWNSRIKVFRQASYRNFQQLGDVPLPLVKNTSQHPGTPYLDVDYVVWDKDSTNVTVAAAAFEDGVDSLNNFIKVSSFVDGTASGIGSNVLANVTNRFTWNVAADWQAEYVNLKVRMMAQDDRGLMSISFITLPEDATNSLPELKISHTPITQFDMLPLWYWLLAIGDDAIGLTAGAVYGVGGAYDGIMLAQGITTTAAGRTFLFDRMGVREATAAELNRAKTGPSGVVNQWTPRITVGPNDRPKLVNEYGFDTGNWGTDGWWVVKE